MDLSAIVMFTTMVFLFISVSYVQSSPSSVLSPAPVPTPAPAPIPPYVDLSDLLSVAGPFHTFLSYLKSTEVIDNFQNQANNSDEGITIFVPKDTAFSSLKNPSLKNLTQDQLKQLVLFHALPHYYSLADFKNLSQVSPVSTLSGAGEYALNFSDVTGTVHLDSGWTKTKISSSIHSTDPVAIYQVDKVLLPEAIFGTDIPPTPAPAPEISPVAADAPSSEVAAAGGHASGTTPTNSSHRIMKMCIWGQFVLAVSTMMAVLM